MIVTIRFSHIFSLNFTLLRNCIHKVLIWLDIASYSGLHLCSKFAFRVCNCIVWFCTQWILALPRDGPSLWFREGPWPLAVMKSCYKANPWHNTHISNASEMHCTRPLFAYRWRQTIMLVLSLALSPSLALALSLPLSRIRTWMISQFSRTLHRNKTTPSPLPWLSLLV